MKIRAIVMLILVLSCSVASAGQDAPWGEQSLDEYTEELPLIAIDESIAKLNSIFDNWGAARETVKEAIAAGNAPDITAFYLFGIMKDPMLLPFAERGDSEAEPQFGCNFYRYRLGLDRFEDHLEGDMQALMEQPYDSFEIMFLPFLEQAWAKQFAAQFRRKADGFVAELLWWSEEIMKRRSELHIPDAREN